MHLSQKEQSASYQQQKRHKKGEKKNTGIHGAVAFAFAQFCTVSRTVTSIKTQ